MRRKMSSRRLRFAAGRIQLYIEWRDMWIGLFISEQAIYLAIFMIVLRVATRPTPTRGAWMLGLPEPADICPGQLCTALETAGWTLAATPRGYSRWQWPGVSDPRSPSIQVPNDRSAPEFAEMMASAVATLTAASAEGQHAETVLALLAGAMLSDPLTREETARDLT